ISVVYLFFFFFQAEDGIRDKLVTGVQTCALPIYPFYAETTLVLVCDVLEPTTGEPYNRDPRGIAKRAEGQVKAQGVGDTISFGRSEERRVGKECRSGW